MDEAEPDPRATMESLGYDIVYQPHERVAAYNAFYRVEYAGEEVAPPAAVREGVPLGEVWLSALLEPYERYILYHELTEIRFRAAGLGVEAAHQRAIEADRVWAGDPAFEEMRREINLAPESIVVALEGFGPGLFDRIMRNRPYCDLTELLAVEGIGPTRFERLAEECWCFDCDL